MTDFQTLCAQRYSCRSYRPEPVAAEKIDYLLECARLAPSAVNRQPWHFYVVEQPETRAALQQTYDREWFRQAPVYVVVTVRHDEAWVRADGKAHGDVDAAIAAEHLCLAATEQGLGTCWVCNFDAAACARVLQLDAHEEPVVLIPVGYPAAPPAEKRRKSLEEVVTHL